MQTGVNIGNTSDTDIGLAPVAPKGKYMPKLGAGSPKPKQTVPVAPKGKYMPKLGAGSPKPKQTVPVAPKGKYMPKLGAGSPKPKQTASKPKQLAPTLQQIKNVIQKEFKQNGNTVSNSKLNAAAEQITKLQSKYSSVSKKTASGVNKNIATLLNKYDLKKIPDDKFKQIVNNYSSAYGAVLSKLDDKISQGVKTLNAKNSSGVLPSDSNYRDLVSNGLVYFNKNTGAWTVTQKGKQFQSQFTINNVPLTTNKIYNDVSNYVKLNYGKINPTGDNRINNAIKTLNDKNSSGILPSNSNYKDLVSNGMIYFNKNTGAWTVTQKGQQQSSSSQAPTSNRIGNAIRTLNDKNSSGVLPSDSNYKDLVSNGLIYFNKNTGAWTVTQKGKQLDDKYAINAIANNIANYSNILNGNLDQNSYNAFIANMTNAQILGNQYLAPSAKTTTQIRQDIANTMANYYNTTNLNPQVINTLSNYVAQRNLNELDHADYQNLVNGLVKGFGLGSNSLGPTGQGIKGQITIDNQNVSVGELQSDVYKTIQRVYANSPQSADVNGIMQEVTTYLNTKGGNVDASNYGDLLTGLVRGYGIGNGTLTY
jgi:predicted transcriptional regulator